MYDIFTLIELVESKPCLWDKTINAYKNKIMRSNAWREICLFFEPEFEGFDDKKKDEIQDSTISNIENYSQDSDNESRSGTSASLKPSQDSDNETTSRIRHTSLNQNSKKRLNPVDVEILKALQSHEPRQDEFKDDDDKAFLMSILPSIKRISEDDRLEFRIDVMQLLRKYTNRIRVSSFSSASSSPLPPVYESVHSPTNEGTPSPPHLPQIENHNMIAPSICSSPPPPHASLPPPSNPPQIEKQMTEPPISPADSGPLRTINELLQQYFDKY
ncbi:unnamed protein product [Euphydryas editha]|uniref:BESS domain-containing protein n=1 Tax=Euphydryas editha TaxID=104508 RepID=A0AAU9UW66_EUPED|nr:unnamed protein product [Euphydryas editha]